MTDGVAIRLKRADVPGEGYDVFVYEVVRGEVHQGQRVEFSMQEEKGAIESLVVISKEKAQDLLDDLWDAGIRPTKAVNNTGVIAAKDQHIAHLAEFLRLALSSGK